MGYAEIMTLSARNRCFGTGIAICALSLIIIVIASFFVLPVYNQASGEGTRRSTGIFLHFVREKLAPAPYVPFATMLGAVIYSLIGIIMILHFFEKTQSPEILFIGLFVISFAFEVLRIIVPLKLILDLSSIYLSASSRILIFSRYFGLFSLFAASICTAGLEVQRSRNIILITAAAALVFAIGIPVDAFSWDTTLNMFSDYDSIFILVQAGIIGITIASFFISAYTRGSKEYVYIGFGTFLAFMGRNILLGSDTWASLFPGLLFLILGTWFICVKLHQIYLWL